IDAELDACPLGRGADAVLVDFHAEATSEKEALGLHLDGRVTCVVGTHTHVPTSDDRVLPGGTAYMSDAGMCGDYNSVLGMQPDEPLNRFLTRIPKGRMEPSLGPGTLCGFAVEIDPKTGLALKAQALQIGGVLRPRPIDFWEAGRFGHPSLSLLTATSGREQRAANSNPGGPGSAAPIYRSRRPGPYGERAGARAGPPAGL